MFLLKSIILHFNWKIKAAFIQREHCWHSIIFHSLLILQKQPNQSLSSPHYTKLSFYHTNQVMSSLFTTLHLGKSPNIECSQKKRYVIWSLPTSWPHLIHVSQLHYSNACSCLSSLHLSFLLAGMFPPFIWLTLSCHSVSLRGLIFRGILPRLPYLKQLFWFPLPVILPFAFLVFFTVIIIWNYLVWLPNFFRLLL